MDEDTTEIIEVIEIEVEEGATQQEISKILDSLNVEPVEPLVLEQVKEATANAEAVAEFEAFGDRLD